MMCLCAVILFVGLLLLCDSLLLDIQKMVHKLPDFTLSTLTRWCSITQASLCIDQERQIKMC